MSEPFAWAGKKICAIPVVANGYARPVIKVIIIIMKKEFIIDFTICFSSSFFIT